MSPGFHSDSCAGWKQPRSSARGILITDDDSTSESITLTVSPDRDKRGRGGDQVTVTGTLHGKDVSKMIVDVFLTIVTRTLRAMSP